MNNKNIEQKKTTQNTSFFPSVKHTSSQDSLSHVNEEKTYKKTAKTINFMVELATKYILLLGILILTAVVGFFIFFVPSKTISMPNLEGKNFIEATVLLQERNLYSKITLRYTNDPADVGKVIKQSPRAGMPIRTKQVVLVTVSKGTIVTEIPDFVGTKLNKAEYILKNQFSGFEHLLKINYISKIFSEQEQGIIIGQVPDAGTKINNAGTKVDIIVSRGSKEHDAYMIDMIGLSYEEVIDYLVEKEVLFEFYFSNSLNPTIIEKENHYLPAGIILEQSPAAGILFAEKPITRIGIRKTNLTQENILVEKNKEQNSFKQYPIKIMSIPLKSIEGTVIINKIINSETEKLLEVNIYQDTITFPYKEIIGETYAAKNKNDIVFWRYQITKKE